jgi:hypothetical protein
MVSLRRAAVPELPSNQQLPSAMTTPSAQRA